MVFIGREKYLKKIRRYATSEPESMAFFGVKGIGKSTIIDNAFSRKKCMEYAEEYRYLYVRAILTPGKKGEDLINFLLDKAINAIDLIGDEEVRAMLQNKIKADSEKYHSKESVLLETLQNIKDYEYVVILIMDEFHNMGRNSEVGSEQYDFLRSLNESGLAYYWIISDSDFSDVYATEQFTTSFFAQKFNPKTVPQMSGDDMLELIQVSAEKIELDLHSRTKDIYEIIGGVPGFVAPALTCIEEKLTADFTTDELIDALLEYPKIKSLMTVWSRSLTPEQKELLVELSERKRIYQSEYQNRGMGTIERINQLGDNSGLGLVLHEEDDAGIYWELTSKIFGEFIIRRRDLFDSAIIKQIDKNEIMTVQPTYIQNNYYNITNNIFNPENALEALVKLKRLVNQNTAQSLPDERIITSAVQQLPFQQEGWDVLEEEEKEEKVEAYADKIFESSDFRADSLTETQMCRFHLTQKILDNLTEGCRNNLISAIQVYDLLQFCIDRFGLTLFNSESARGILFAKVYESILKEILKPALVSVDEVATKEIMVNRINYSLKDAPNNEMTINNFSFLLNQWDVQDRLGSLCTLDLGIDECDRQWWKNHMYEIRKIGFLRNDCCHSGDCFTAEKLDELIKRLFEDGAIAQVVVYNDITNRIV